MKFKFIDKRSRDSTVKVRPIVVEAILDATVESAVIWKNGDLLRTIDEQSFSGHKGAASYEE